MEPHAMALDAAGNLYFADYFGNCISKISRSGLISTVVGYGPSGYYGDGKTAATATLSNPTGVAWNRRQGLVIADYFNDRIRKVNSQGAIVTMAGNGVQGYSGDGGRATQARFYWPHAVKMDVAGNLFIADRKNHCIRKVNAAGIISTVAGNGMAGFAGDGGAAPGANLNNPFAVALDGAGNLFIADEGNNRIRKVDTKGVITTIAGNGDNTFSGDGGAATNASLHSPEGVTVDNVGNLYVADENNCRVRKIDTKGIITSVAGIGLPGYAGDGESATNSLLFNPKNVLTDPHGNLFIADGFNNRIRKVDAHGIITTVAGQGLMDNGPATNANFCQPNDMALDAAGDLFIADYGNSRIREVKNGLVFTVAGNGVQGHSGDGGAATNAALYYPAGVVVDYLGNLCIADLDNECIRKVDTNGIITTVAGNGTAGYSGDYGYATDANLNHPERIVVDNDGNLFIADAENSRVRHVTRNGFIYTVAGNGKEGYSGDGGAATAAELAYPCGVTVAGTGKHGFSGDTGSPGNATLFNPVSVTVDSYGNPFIADLLNNRIRKVGLETAQATAKLTVVGTVPNGWVATTTAGGVGKMAPVVDRVAPNFNGGFTLHFVSRPGSTNVVQSTTNLSQPLWYSLATNRAADDGEWQFTDTNAASYPARFYRSLLH
jgi:sugar lactone lactonase YvrE